MLNNTEINPATNAMASVALSVLQGEKGKELAFLVQDEFISKPNKYDGSIPHNLSSKETFAVDGALTSAAFHYIGISAEYMMLHAYRTCRNDFNNAYFEKSLYAEKKDEPNTFLNAAMVLGTHSLLAEYRRKRAGEMFKKIEDNIPTHEIVSEGKTVGCLFSNRFSKKFERAYVADNALMAINYLLLDRKKEAEMLLNGIERSAVKKRYEDGLQLYYPELDAEPDNQKIMALPNILLAIAYMAMKDREW